MSLKIRQIPIAACILFIIVLVAALLVPVWHSFPIVAFSSTSVFLEEYNSRAYNGEEACVKMNFHVPENILAETVVLRIFSENTPLFFEEFDAVGKDFEKIVCFSTAALSTGDNRIEVLAFGKNLFFHLEKIDRAKPFAKDALLENVLLEDGVVNFSVKDFDTGFVRPVEIMVNGELDHTVYPFEEEQFFSEKIKMHPGQNTVSLSLGGKTTEKSFEKQAIPSIPFPLGLVLIVFAMVVFACGLFPERGFFEKTALSMAISFALIIVLVFSLNYLGVLNFYSVAGCFIAIVLAVLLFFRKNIKKEFLKKRAAEITPLIAVAVCLFLLVPVIFHIFSFTEVTYWNKFYERQSALIVAQDSVPVWDELAYLGRTYSFAPGYFMLESGIIWITGLEDQGIYASMLVMSNAFLLVSLFFLGKSLKIENKRIALFSLLAAMSGFLLSAMCYSPRHVFSFSFFVIALALLCNKRKSIMVGFFLAIAAFIQFPLLIFFPLFYAIIAKKVDWKRLTKTFGFALVFTLIFMIPNLLLYGLPFQASPEEWGYLIDYNAYYWFIDIVAILAFFLLFTFVDIVKKRACNDFYSKKLLAGFILGTLIQLFIIYRWNILTTTTLALLIAVAFPKNALKGPLAERLTAFLIIVTFGFLLFGMSYLNVHEIVTTPVSFIEQRTSTDSRVLADPMFGHDITSVAERAALADLRVEYADEEKLLDAYDFLETKDYSILKKYGITHVFNQVDYIHRQAIGGKPKYGIIEFYPLDKVYSNGFIFVHRVMPGEKN